MLWQIVPMRNYSVAEEVLPNVQSSSGSEKLHTVSSECADCMSLLRTIVCDVVSCLVHADVWIISDGRNYGASRFIGRLLAESKKKSKPSNVDSDDNDSITDAPSDPVLIGVSHWGSLKRKQLLCGISVSRTLCIQCNAVTSPETNFNFF